MNRLIFWLGVLGVSLLANSVVQGEGPTDGNTVVRISRQDVADTRVPFRFSRSFEILKTVFN